MLTLLRRGRQLRRLMRCNALKSKQTAQGLCGGCPDALYPAQLTQSDRKSDCCRSSPNIGHRRHQVSHRGGVQLISQALAASKKASPGATCHQPATHFDHPATHVHDSRPVHSTRGSIDSTGCEGVPHARAPTSADCSSQRVRPRADHLPTHSPDLLPKIARRAATHRAYPPGVCVWLIDGRVRQCTAYVQRNGRWPDPRWPTGLTQ